jgi:hypothetical protein
MNNLPEMMLMQPGISKSEGINASNNTHATIGRSLSISVQ